MPDLKNGAKLESCSVQFNTGARMLEQAFDGIELEYRYEGNNKDHRWLSLKGAVLEVTPIEPIYLVTMGFTKSGGGYGAISKGNITETFVVPMFNFELLHAPNIRGFGLIGKSERIKLDEPHDYYGNLYVESENFYEIPPHAATFRIVASPKS